VMVVIVPIMLGERWGCWTLGCTVGCVTTLGRNLVGGCGLVLHCGRITLGSGEDVCMFNGGRGGNVDDRCLMDSI
jgi:hypothetical protein